MNIIAINTYKTWARGLFIPIFLALAGCALPSAPDRPAVYDFGPGPRQMSATDLKSSLPPLGLADLEAPRALDTPAMLYRLMYSDSQQLRPYAVARWSMTPAQLVRQRLREQLGQRRAILAAGDKGLAGAATPPTLRIELEEFSQLFETPGQSVGLLRLRATLVQAGSSGERLMAQRSVIVQRPAPTADAAGGVRALTAAVDAAVLEIEQWLTQMPF